MNKAVRILREVLLMSHDHSLVMAAGQMSESAYAEWLKANSKRK